MWENLQLHTFQMYGLLNKMREGNTNENKRVNLDYFKNKTPHSCQFHSKNKIQRT